MAVILFIIAVIMAIKGIIELSRNNVGPGVLWLVGACLVGPGGVSIFT